MRRILVVAAAVTGLLAGAVAAVAIVGTPEIDQANVTLSLATRTPFVPTACAGEDGTNYRTLRGIWNGNEVEVAPGSTDYNLTGPITVNRVEWTINLKSQRGVLTGLVTLRSPTGGTDKTYSGPLTLITQGIPNADRPASARGWLDAPTYTAGTADGGKVLANVELKIDNTFAAKGGFGDTPALFGTPSYAVTTANTTC
jgi:hypothetical protein